MRDRLIELIDQKQYQGNSTETGVNYIQNPELADHLIANGVILPPVKVGQTVWIIDEPEGYGGDVEPYILAVPIVQIGQDAKGVWCVMELSLGFKRSGYLGTCEIGKTVFLTKEDAEKALKEKENVHI